MKAIVTEGCTFLIIPPTGNGTVEIKTEPSSIAKISGNGIYRGPLEIKVSNYTSAVITVPGSGKGSGILQPSSQKVKNENKAVVLDGDSASIVINGKATTPQGTVPAAETITVKVIANQQKVMGV